MKVQEVITPVDLENYIGRYHRRFKILARRSICRVIARNVDTDEFWVFEREYSPELGWRITGLNISPFLPDDPDFYEMTHDDFCRIARSYLGSCGR